jgi:hypothetical protein
LEVLEDRCLLSFGPPTAVGAGGPTWGIAAGVLTSSGNTDLVKVNNGDDSVGVLLGNGDGSFQEQQNYSTGSGTYTTDVAIADVNNDGIPDIITANAGNDTVSVLLGNGDGTFGPPTLFDVGVAPYSVAVGDFNEDGNADLAVAGNGGTTVSVLLGNGDGTFNEPTIYTVPAGAYQLVVGNFTNDGHQDLAVSSYYTGSVSILLGNGDGTFGPPTTFAAGPGVFRLATADFNHDGNLDIVTANFNSNTVSVLLGNGDGTFGAPINLTVAAGNVAYVTVDDFNQDGNPDIVATSFESDSFQSNTLSVLLGNGDGTFQAFQSYPAGSNTYYVTTGDFNNDGFPDIAVGNFDTGQVSVLLNNADWPGPLVLGDGGAGGTVRQPLSPALGISMESNWLARDATAGKVVVCQPDSQLLPTGVGHTEQSDVQLRDALFAGITDAFPVVPL